MKIVIDEHGPYLVYGRIPIRQQFIEPDADDFSWSYRTVGKNYTLPKEPTALCRCGGSKNKPYCDGSHLHVVWNPNLTASVEPLLGGAKRFVGPTLTLADNEKFCAFARFCEARGRTWNLNEESDDPQKREAAIRTAEHCPAGRLTEWDNQSGKPFEPQLEHSIGLLEDSALGLSAGLWVQGGVDIISKSGLKYENRNRVTLCRCGGSSNKPYCDGTHATMKFKDGL
ncbi:MAG: CDGSH iron-sulfur domain-containing protein [Mucinivorans sp.]